MLFTNSQQRARDTVVQMGRLFYSGANIMPDLKLRLFPLIAGPTGSGKSFLVETAARKLDAKYCKVVRGDWIVTGSRAGRPTTFQILDYVATYDRVLLHIDELDKLGSLQGSEWSASIASDVWNVLDLKFQLEEFIRQTTVPGRQPPTVEEMETRIRRLWIVGSGTWQEMFESRRASNSIGFCQSPVTERVDSDVLARSSTVSPELIGRFNGDVRVIDYPTLEETRNLLKSSGISRLARRLGVSIEAEDIDWTQGGMRALETVATRLALLHQQRCPELQSRPEPAALVEESGEAKEPGNRV